MRCLVTGGAGFIGSHLVERLMAEGHHVRVVDNMFSGSENNLAGVEDRSRLKIFPVDIRDAEALTPCFEGVERVFHLAGLADIVPSIEQPDDYYTTNVTGTFNVLQAMRDVASRGLGAGAGGGDLARLVYAASSSCYGIPDHFPTPEDAEIRPQYPYALTKRLGEELVLHWCQVYGLPAISLRLFNVYGPRSRTSGAYGAVFGVFLAQKLKGEPYTVVGDGTQTRDFTYVTDVANAFAMAAESELSGEIFNVGSGGHQSVNRLVELLGGDVVHLPKRPGEPDCTFADTRRIEEHLNWRAAISFEEGVSRMLERIDAWKDAPLWRPDAIAKATEGWFRYLGDEDADGNGGEG